MNYFETLEYERHAWHLEVVENIHLVEDHHCFLNLDVEGVQLLYELF